MFETGSFSFKKPFDMYLNCPKCGQKYFPTPGFYYGAMFISYIMTGWFSVLTMLGLHWWFGMSFNRAFIVLLAVIAGFAPAWWVKVSGTTSGGLAHFFGSKGSVFGDFGSSTPSQPTKPCLPFGVRPLTSPSARALKRRLCMVQHLRTGVLEQGLHP